MQKVEKPWGYYRVLEETDKYKVKEIVIMPGQRTSLHTDRRRLW